MPMRRSSFSLLPAALTLFALLGGSVPASAKSAHPAKPHTKTPHTKAPPAAPSAESLFVKVLRADDLFSYKGRQFTTYWRTGRAIEVLVFHRPMDDRRMQF